MIRGTTSRAGGAVADLLSPGTNVEVRTGYDRSWATGFEVVEADDAGYAVRRLSDGTVLPHRFDADDVRRPRRRSSMWWV